MTVEETVWQQYAASKSDSGRPPSTVCNAQQSGPVWRTISSEHCVGLVMTSAVLVMLDLSGSADGVKALVALTRLANVVIVCLGL